MLDKMKTTQQPFSAINFLMIGACCILIVIGFLLMVGGGSSIENGFNPEIFSARRIVVGPLLAFLGFLLLAFAILADPQKIKQYLKKRNSPKNKPDGMA